MVSSHFLPAPSFLSPAHTPGRWPEMRGRHYPTTLWRMSFRHLVVRMANREAATCQSDCTAAAFVVLSDRLTRILRGGATDVDGGALDSASRAAEVKVEAMKSASASADDCLSSSPSAHRTAPTRIAGYIRLNRRMSMPACLAEILVEEAHHDGVRLLRNGAHGAAIGNFGMSCCDHVGTLHLEDLGEHRS